MTVRGFVVLAVGLLSAGPGVARDALPCVQVLAPGMTPGQVWRGEPLDGVPADAAMRDPEAARLVVQATSLGVEASTLVPRLQDFAAASPEKVLPLVAASFERLKAMRIDTLAAIRDAGLGLRRRLDVMDARLGEIEHLTAGSEAREALETRQSWDLQVIENGRRLLAGLCERPARIDARFGVIARSLSQRP